MHLIIRNSIEKIINHWNCRINTRVYSCKDRQV